MSDKFWKAKERRILKRFGLTRIGGTGHANPDGRGNGVSVEVFTHEIPGWLSQEFAQAERDLHQSEERNNYIPWAVFGPKGGSDSECFVCTKLRYFPRSDDDELKDKPVD